MRPIKFRAWDTINNKWVKPEDLDNPEVCSVRVTDVGFRLLNEEESDFIYCQFTGLLDKNGKEIYEGDVMHYKARHYEFNGEIVFRDGGYALKRNGQTYELCAGAIQSCDIMEVIGNIYENPDILH